MRDRYQVRDVQAASQKWDAVQEKVVKLSMKEHLSGAELEEFNHQVHLIFTHVETVPEYTSTDEGASANRTSEIEVPPSSYLYGLGLLLDKSTREMVINPLIDDFHYEYFEALAKGRPTRRLIRVYRYHGTVALLRALCIGFWKQLVSGGN